MNKVDAQELAAQITRESPGTTAIVEPDEMIPWCDEWHIDVYKPNVIQFCVRSTEQWNERKHLISKWQSHE